MSNIPAEFYLCPICDGKGTLLYPVLQACPHCKGTGKLPELPVKEKDCQPEIGQVIAQVERLEQHITSYCPDTLYYQGKTDAYRECLKILRGE